MPVLSMNPRTGLAMAKPAAGPPAARVFKILFGGFRIQLNFFFFFFYLFPPEVYKGNGRPYPHSGQEWALKCRRPSHPPCI